MRKLAFLLSAFVLAGISVQAQNVEVNGIYYKITNGEASITAYQEVSGDVVIPESVPYNGVSYPVTNLSQYAFHGCMNLTSITIPASVTNIAYYAFNVCTSLTRVTFSDSDEVLSLGFGASGGQSRGLFADCPLEYLYLGRDLSYVSGSQYGYSPFYGQESLTEVVIGNQVTSLGNYLLSGAKVLSSINLPSSLYSIGNYTFADDSVLARVDLPQELYVIGNNAFKNCVGMQGVMTIPSNIEAISKYAFSGCTGLTGFVLPDGLTTIAEGAFAGCTGLTSVDIPAGVTSIADLAFNGCTGIRSVSFYDSATPLSLPTTITASLFADSPLESLYLGRTIEGDIASAELSPFYGKTALASVMIGSKVSALPDYAFAGCSAITGLSFPASVVEIGNFAFNGCTSITNLTFAPASTAISLGYGGTEQVKHGLFYDCPLVTLTLGRDVDYNYGGYEYGYSPFAQINALENVTFGNQVTSINPYLLRNDAGINTVTVPSSVTSIGAECMLGTSVKTIVMPAALSVLESNSMTQFDEIHFNGSAPVQFTETQTYTVVFVPDNLFEAYIQAEGWSNVEYKIVPESYMAQKTVNVQANPTGPAIRDAIGDDNKLNLYYNLKLTGTINGYDIVTLRNRFINLRHLDLSEVSVLANDEGHEYYTGYSLQQDNELGDYAFYDLNLESVVLPSTLLRVGVNAFSMNPKLAQVSNLGSVEVFDSHAFEGCSLLDGLVFDRQHIVYIGKYAFANCTSLSNVSITTAEEMQIDTCAFYGCTGLKNLYLYGGKPIDIKKDAFRNCSSMTVAFLGKGVRNVEDNAFMYCTLLNNLEFGSTLLNLGNYAFSYCSSLESVMLPTSLQTIGDWTFSHCASMREVKLPSSLLTIGDRAFSGSPLTEVYTYTIEPTDIDQNTFSSYLSSTLYIPLTSKENYYSNTQWGKFFKTIEFDEPYEYFYLNNDYMLDESTGRISGTPDMTMNSGSGFIVEGPEVQTIDELEYYHDGEDGASIIAGNDQDANLEINSMKVNIGIEGGKWYFFCFPFDVYTDSIECTSDYIFYKYDAKRRARGLSGWVKLADNKLTYGKGNIFMMSNTGILTMHIRKEDIYFSAQNRTVQVENSPSENPQDDSWNLIGNAFISYYDMTDVNTDLSEPVAIWDPETNTYTAYRMGDDDVVLKPFQAFFVQRNSSFEFVADGQMTETETAAITQQRANMRRILGTTVNPSRLLVNITLANMDGKSDRARVVYSEKAQMGYEIGVDASKFESEAKLQIYTINDNLKYSINERPFGNDDIRIGYQVSQAGTYVLDVPRMDADVVIYDKVMGWDVDLSNGGYMFDTKAGTFNDRFVVRMTGGVTAVDGNVKLSDVVIKPVDGGIAFDTDKMQQIEIYHPSGILAGIHNGAGTIPLLSGTYLVKVNDKNVKITVK
ncbi:MAG: leucine-rich repeat domain-containing protein [Bacteroidaceae bacterium]|nr:leucine-rich repeat domain-containing protein [Bacteroidaceae bacterium]